MILEKLKRKLQHISDVYGCTVISDSEHTEGLILSGNDSKTHQKKWMITFDYKENSTLSIRSFGLGYFDHHISNFPLSDIDKDVVDLSPYIAEEDISGVKRTEVNFISDKTIDVIKLVVEEDAEGLHVELIESRDTTDFSIMLSDYFNCAIPEIDEDGFQHYLIQKEGDGWIVRIPEIGSWTQETLHNALVLDYSYAEQLIHFTFFNKDAQLVQQSNVFVRAIEKNDDELLFHSVKRNKKIRLVMDDRMSLLVTY